ncbi:DNA polymerase III subunit beta [Lentibacillus sp. N15]|uniref:DNA polymerase III subunit beta n=1 Tax=Lentibacillus songyuanensis TaxID=3136161 RepID=UPI0031BB1D3D
MEFQIEKGIFNNAIKKGAGAVSTRAVVPALSGVHLVANEEGIIITGSDSDLSIRTFIQNDEMAGAEILNAGSIILPAKQLSNIVRSMPDNIISVKMLDGLKVEISSGKSKFTLNGMDGNEYPKLPEIKGESFQIKATYLKEMIDKTIYAVSKIDARPIITGVNLFAQNGRIAMVATDSHRLSKVVGDEVAGDIPNTVTLPEKTLKELSSLISDSSYVTVMQKDNQIVFQTDEFYVLSRVLEGNYPQTDRLIPMDYKTLLTADRRQLLSSIERSAILATENNTITLKVTNKNNGIFETIELSHTNSELGQSKEDIIVEKIEGEEITISFNPKYMIDALKRIDEETVVIEFNGTTRPFVIKPLEKHDFIQLALPVRIY